MGTNQPWSKEREDELRRLFFHLEDGKYYLSHNYIAALMPGIGRAAVVGKIRRLKLERDPTIPYISANGFVIDPQVTNFKAKSDPMSRSRLNVSDAEREGAGEYTGTPSEFACQLVELNDKKCHFPIGHVGHDGFHFCGDTVTRGVYCAFHASVCFAPPKPRRSPVRPSYRR